MLNIILLLLFGIANADICVVRVQDGHSNEQDTISKSHCELYDRLHHNNVSTLQTIHLDGTIAGCWVYETDVGEVFYWNNNLNPSGMCAHPHYCVQYVDCSEGTNGAELLYTSPTPPPTETPPPTAPTIGIGTVAVTQRPTSTPTLKKATIPTKDIIMICTIVLVTLLFIMGYVIVRTNKRGKLYYPN
tara:strand:- start:40 stop:603 length:564 start_codon:yes stop_codon:yes gene_type:complete